MKILNFGSLNLDHVYHVPHFVRAGETLGSTGYKLNIGGKGLNQSVALARAGAETYHAGLIGPDGGILRDFLDQYGVDTSRLKTIDAPTGHAIIQVIPEGNNCILLFGGANQMVTPAIIDETLEGFGEGDFLVLQNEVNDISRIAAAAADRGMQVVLNPSPIAPNIHELDYSRIHWMILNEIEGEAMCGEQDQSKMAAALSARYPGVKIVLTLGENGSVYTDGNSIFHQPAFKVKAVDTTAAGDTFSGFFLAAVSCGIAVPDALKRAAVASSITVTRPGAGASIPDLNEVLEKMSTMDQ